MKKVEDYVVTIPDFPEPGIMFRDVTSILQDADGLQLAIDEMMKAERSYPPCISVTIWSTPGTASTAAWPPRC